MLLKRALHASGGVFSKSSLRGGGAREWLGQCYILQKTEEVKQLFPPTTAQYVVVAMLVLIASQLQGQGLDPSTSS
jgi:hypothetical protein